MEQEKIINEILDTPLSERSISDIFNMGSSRGELYNVPDTPDSSTLGTTAGRRGRHESAATDFCLDDNNNVLLGGARAPGSPMLGRSPPATTGATRLQRLNPGLTLNTLNGFSSSGVGDSSTSNSPWLDSPLFSPMTPQVVRSSLDNRFSQYSSTSNSSWIDSPVFSPMTPQVARSPLDTRFFQYSSGSPPFGSHSLESCSPPYFPSDGEGGDYSPYYHTGGNGGAGDYFPYPPTTNGDSHAHPLNTSMTDSSNVDNIDDLLAGLSLNPTGWNNLQNLASMCTLQQPGLDPYTTTILAHQYCENLRKHRDLVNQLDSVLASLMTGQAPGPARSPGNSPMHSPRSNSGPQRHSPSSGGGYYGAGGSGYHNGGGDCGGGGYGMNGGGGGIQSTLDIAARHHRSSANSQVPTKTWEGVLPLRTSFTDEILSNKIFLGGVPWDTPEYLLLTVFSQFGPVKVEWPQGTPDSPTGPKGFAYLVYDSYTSAKSMLEHCAFDGNSYYYKIPSKKRGRDNHASMVRNFKDVEVVPWAISDSNYSPHGHSTKLEPGKTIFVGALHGRLTAQALFNVMNDLFGDVVYAGIDTDKHKYPIGSGRITFGSTRAYSDAIRAAFIQVKSGRICKKLQLDPYLEDNVCSECQTHSGPYFCREGICYRYFCRSCWLKVHIGDYSSHDPIVRNVRKSPPSSPSGHGAASLGSSGHGGGAAAPGSLGSFTASSIISRGSLI
uniref:Cytoplasmic polyadenylation element-binding protein 1 n=1 Tax=Cacopsylla melanoneura TaxID=428564 RepID=A0A8D8M179_9HEMI